MIIQAVGIRSGEKGEIVLATKKTKHHNRPAANKNEVTFAGNKSGPKSVPPKPGHLRFTEIRLHRIYKGIVNYTARQGYRADLRREAVARASALRQSSQPKKDIPEKKLRGSKAKKASDSE